MPAGQAAVVDAPLFHESSPPLIFRLPTGAIEVHVRQPPGESGTAEAIFEFDREMRFERAHVSDAYWKWHGELEMAGRLDHNAANCPDRIGLPVREWTPSSGWRDRSVAETAAARSGVIRFRAP